MTTSTDKRTVVSGSLAHGYGAREWDLLTDGERRNTVNYVISQLDEVSQLSASPDDVIESALTVRFHLVFRNLAARRGFHIPYGRATEMVDRALEYLYDTMKKEAAS